MKRYRVEDSDEFIYEDADMNPPDKKKLCTVPIPPKPYVLKYYKPRRIIWDVSVK